MPVLTPSEMS